MPEKVSLPQSGSCHCGAVRYELSAPPLMVYNCHCTNCQKISGGAFATSATVPEAAFRIAGGAPKRIEWKSDAGNTRYGLFCGDCGSRIAHGQVPPIGFLSLRAGTLDDTSWVESVGDIWTRSAQPGQRFAGLTAERQPADYAPFVAKYREQARF